MSDRHGDAFGPGSRASTEPAMQSPPSASIPIADLIKRLEEATEGSRELDALVWATILPTDGIGLDGYGLVDGAYYENVANEGGTVNQLAVVDGKRYGRAVRNSPHYTTSLDAALSLVACPEDHGPLWTWSIEARLNGEGRHSYEAQITVPSREWMGWSRTPALALVIAALKARAHV